MNNFNKLLLTVSCFFVLSNAVHAQGYMSQGTRKMATAMTLIEKMYVDDVDGDKLSEDAIRSLLANLDPHSSYATAEEEKEMSEPLEGNFDGIGVSFNMLVDTLYIVETISGGPSEKVGIRAGDRIVSVDDTIIAGVKMSNRDIMKRLRGPKGTAVRVKILRRGVPELIDFKIIRDKIPIHSIDASYMVDKKTGYIRLSRFGATTLNEFQTALSKLQSQGMTNLIFDLQYNGGGYLSAAIGIVNEVLGKDKLIVYTEGKHQPKYSEKSNAKGSFENGKLVILVNEGSASASEIVSGAVQDWDRGVIVGRRTFGKGLVQRQFPLPDGSMIRLTVARYYTPTGRCIQKPYENGDKDSYDKEMINRYNHGEMVSADSIHFPDSLKYKTLINARTVYGGGGIMPDYFVPMDTTQYPEYYRKISAKGLVYRVALNELDANRKQILSKYSTSKQFEAGYKVPQSVLTELIKVAKDEEIEYNEEQFQTSKKEIESYIRAIIARDLYDAASYYQIVNETSDVYRKGLDIINDDKLYNSLLKGNK